MNTRQLAVAWIAALSSASILAAHGLTRVAPAHLVAAIALLATVLIYSLRPLPGVNKPRLWLVVALTLLTCTRSIACYVDRYQSRNSGPPGSVHFR